MRIRNRILLGFMLLGLVIGIAGYISFSISRGALEKTIGNQSVELARTTMDHVLDTIQQRMDDIRRHTPDISGHEILVQSNLAFDQMEDVNGMIQSTEADWQAEEPSRYVQDITGNTLSQYLREQVECDDYFLGVYGHKVFGECFVTNKYGINVAQTRKTTDYYQADEVWWQKAKEEGTYVGQIQYDKSAGLYEVDLSVRLDDTEGRFVGVMKAVLNIQELIEAVETLKARSQYITTRFRLVSNYVVMYDTQDRTLLTGDLEPLLLNAIMKNNEQSGYMEAVNNSGMETLLAFYRIGHSDSSVGPDIMMIIDHEKDEVLQPIAKLEFELVCVTVFLFFVSAFCAWIVAVDISKPLVALKQMALEISKGNLNIRSNVKALGEVGQLAETFDRMTEDLKKTLGHLENEIAVRRRAEDALENKNRELTDTLRRVKHAKKQLEEFAHIAAHDIKSPVRAIGTLTDWIMDNHQCHMGGEIKTYLDQLKHKAKHLNDLSDSIIQYCEITTDKTNETVDCYGLVLKLLDTLSIPPSVTVSVEGNLPSVSYAPGHLKLLFRCLIDNAVRYSAESEGTVTIACTETDQGWVFSVGDNGPGIPHRYHEKIFKMFQRLNSDENRLGMGLAMAKKIVEIHDGAIWVESTEGKGSTFFFTILYSEESSFALSATA